MMIRQSLSKPIVFVSISTRWKFDTDMVLLVLAVEVEHMVV